MADFIHEIKNRRVLPAVGVYVGSCWVLVEILDRLVERYLLSPYFTDMAFWGLYSLIPAVILIAWTHGKPGKDETTTAEKVGVPINIIATLGLLITAFGGKDLGATANLITLNNEEGVQESHYVPRDTYRQRLAVFFFENDSGDPDLDWLQYGTTELLVQDLQQNPFVLASSPWSNYVNGFYSRMRQAGFEDGLGVPRSLMREIAADANRQYFVEGSIGRAEDEYQVTARIWDTQSLQLVDELTETGWDLFATVDALSVEVRESLDVPEGRGRIADDLPLSATYGESEGAFQSYVSGLNARLFDNDFEGSNAHFDAALEMDEGFVLAWFSKALNLLESGDLPSSQVAIKQAQALDYRLPDADRVTLKALNYRISGQQEKLIAFLRMQTRLRDDATSHSRLAGMLMAMGEIEEAKERYLEALDKDPLNLGIYLQLSLLERATGNPEAAIHYAERYRSEKPEDIEAHLLLGDFLRDTGELEAAGEHYLQASMLENLPVAPMLRMADIATRKGDANAARELLAQAEEAALTPLDKGQVRQAATLLEIRLGRLRASIDQLYAQEEFLKQAVAPLQVAVAIYVPMVGAYVYLGETENAEAALDKAMQLVQPPLDKFMSFSEVFLLLEKNDIEGARQALARGEELIDQFKLEDLRTQVDMLNGYILRKEGNHAASADSFRSASERLERSVIAGTAAYAQLPQFLSELARSLVFSGDLDGAEVTLNEGFRVDPANPILWVTKARHQFASGLPQLAFASVNYALAIWKDSDPEYKEYRQALMLADQINQAI